MRTLIGMLLLAISFAAYQANPARDKYEQANDASGFGKQENRKEEASLPPIPEQAIDGKPAKSAGQNKTNDTSDDPPDWANRINAGSTLIIAIFTICLFVGLIVQIKTSRNIERAWILPSVEWRSRKWSSGRGHILEGNVPGRETTTLYAQLICKNEGRCSAPR